MVAHRAPQHDTRLEKVVRSLVAVQLAAEGCPGRYALFFVTGEGDFLPNGLEETSGYVLTEQGRVFSFWLGWDARERTPMLTEWQEERPEPHWARSAEYRQSREAVGLANG